MTWWLNLFFGLKPWCMFFIWHKKDIGMLVWNKQFKMKHLYLIDFSIKDLWIHIYYFLFMNLLKMILISRFEFEWDISWFFEIYNLKFLMHESIYYIIWSLKISFWLFKRRFTIWIMSFGIQMVLCFMTWFLYIYDLYVL